MRKLSTCRHASVKLGHFCAGFLFGISTGLIKVALHEGQNTQKSAPIHAEADFTKSIRKLTGTNTKLELKNTRVMCIFYKKRTVNILHQLRIARRSWTNKCTSVLVFIDSYNRTIPAVSFYRLPDWVKISQSNLITGLRYVFGNHFHDADWFFISRGIPYVIMENLRHFLSNQDNSNAVYWGHKLKRRTFVEEVIYPDDFAGIVLSKQALYRLGTQGQYKRVCNEVDTEEGIVFSMCMAGLGIRFGDTRDGENKSRFLLYSPGSYLDDNLPVTPWREDLELGSSRPSALISSSLISFGRAPVSRYPGYSYTIHNLITISNET